MISLETIGYFSSRPGSQRYPAPGLGLLYPRTGNFIGFVGNVASRALLRTALGEFRRHAKIPSEGAALPEMVPGVGWSDQWSFWQHGYPGIMVTDTAPFRFLPGVTSAFGALGAAGIPPTMHPTKTLRQLPPWRRWLTAQQPVRRNSGSATRMVRS
jgi:hypothetical protein